MKNISLYIKAELLSLHFYSRTQHNGYRCQNNICAQLKEKLSFKILAGYFKYFKGCLIFSTSIYNI